MNFKSNLAPRKRVAVDLSRKLIPQFIEIPPYAKDPDTGKFLNESPYPKLKELDPKDIQKEIDSYAQDCDIYNIIRRSQQGLDVSYAFKEKQYADLSNIPDNKLDLIAQAEQISKVSLSDDVKEALLSNMTDEEILAILKKKVEADTSAPAATEVKDNVA